MESGLRLAVAVVIFTAAAAHVAGWQERFTRVESDRFAAKLDRIVSLANGRTRRAAGAETTRMTDAEVTAYLRHHARDQVPVGIVEPTLTALGEGRVGGRAIVDLDAVRNQKQRGWLDPLAYLTGKVPLTATGRLITQSGVGRFQLESAEISGVTIPKTVLQELLTHYSRTPQNPNGINMDAPFELPSRIREIQVQKGEAVVVQ
jgi:hypothetical protein